MHIWTQFHRFFSISLNTLLPYATHLDLDILTCVSIQPPDHAIPSQNIRITYLLPIPMRGTHGLSAILT